MYCNVSVCSGFIMTQLCNTLFRLLFVVFLFFYTFAIYFKNILEILTLRISYYFTNILYYIERQMIMNTIVTMGLNKIRT